MKTPISTAVSRQIQWPMLFGLPLLLAAATGLAQSTFDFDPFTVAGGGGNSSGGSYTISGTAGQPDASGEMSGGTIVIRGGFWQAYAATQAPAGALRLVLLPGNPMQLLLHGPTNRTVKIQASDHLGAQANWSLIATTNNATTPCLVCRLTPTTAQRYFRAMVVEPNRPPVLQPIGSRQVAPGQPLSFTATAYDSDTGQTLTFSLDAGAPSGASINATSGLFSWTPSAAGNYPITVRVTDNGDPPLSDFETITVAVKTNHPPVLPPITDKTVNEEATLTFTVSATDPDAGQTLTYLGLGLPVGASINAANGAFSWTPGEAQGPGSYPITIRVTDDGTPPRSDEKSFTITVNEVNQAPILGAIGNKSVRMNVPLTFTAAATDPDLPAQTLAFSLAAGAPAGATIDSATGVFNWTPTNQGSFQVTVKVTDNGSPALSDEETITITVNAPPSGPVLTGPATSTGSITLVWNYTWGTSIGSQDGYQLEEATSASGPFTTILNTVGTGDRQSPKTNIISRAVGSYWYRVRAYRSSPVPGYTEYSDVLRVDVATPPTVTRFVNNTAYLIYSLKIDNVEQLLPCYYIPPGGWGETAVSPGTHRYTMLNGILDDFCVGINPNYDFTNTWTQRQGVREVITFNNPTIQANLSRGSNQQEWYADWWDVNTLQPHVNRFIFYLSGSYAFYLDQETTPRATGTYQQLSRNAAAGSVTFVVYSNPNFQATLYEFFGFFTMTNGPAGQMLQYFPR